MVAGPVQASLFNQFSARLCLASVLNSSERVLLSSQGSFRLDFSADYFLKGGSTVLRCVPGTHTGPRTLFTGENTSVYMKLIPES